MATPEKKIKLEVEESEIPSVSGVPVTETPPTTQTQTMVQTPTEIPTNRVTEMSRRQAEPLKRWDWLSPEVHQHIFNMAGYATANERLDKGWRKVHAEMEELPRCRVYGTVINFACFECLP